LYLNPAETSTFKRITFSIINEMQYSLLLSLISFVVLHSGCTQKDATNEQVEHNSLNINDCLISYDWIYPSDDNPLAAWKFNPDKTFNYSTKLLGGMTAWGTWNIISPEQISIHFTKTTENYTPKDDILRIEDCNGFTIGSTRYIMK
jgi:hypothetical protein